MRLGDCQDLKATFSESTERGNDKKEEVLCVLRSIECRVLQEGKKWW